MMKVAILTLALVALAASVAYAAPAAADNELEAMIQELLGSKQEKYDAETEEFFEDKASEQEDYMQSLAAQIEEVETDALLQKFFAQEQMAVPVKMQGWFKKIFKKVGKFVKKNKGTIIKTGLKYLLGR